MAGNRPIRLGIPVAPEGAFAEGGQDSVRTVELRDGAGRRGRTNPFWLAP